MQTTSKNSLTAKSGFKAEEIFRTDSDIKLRLEKYFGKGIKSLDKVHGKKYDTRIVFEDGTISNIQNKKIENLGGRGDSFDRRCIQNTFHHPDIISNLELLTLSRPTKTTTSMTEDEKRAFVKLCNDNLDDIKQYVEKTLIGEEGEKNEYWCIMKTDKTFSSMELYMIKSEVLMGFVEKTLNIDIKMKSNGTCLHLSPNIALQRKGGGKTDSKPDDIQAKLKCTQDILDLCERIL